MTRGRCPSLFLFLFLAFIVGKRGSRAECEIPNPCGQQGLFIMSPFRLKDQPDHCGHPEFELSCSPDHQAMLELPVSIKPLVKSIDYKSQEIIVQYRPEDRCYGGQYRSLNLSASPFYFKYEHPELTILSCSSNKSSDSSFVPIPCISTSDDLIYGVESSAYVLNLDLSSCRRLYNYSLTDDDKQYILNGAILLRWSVWEPDKGVQKQHIIVLGALYFFLVIINIPNKREKENRIKVRKFLEDYEALKPSRYTYADVKSITNQFEDKLGQGGFGTVYKGKILDKIFVAVKILDNFQGNGEEFINEVATMGTIHHVNVVRLVGFCADRSKRALIYEYLPNKSLEKFIFPKAIKGNLLSWKKLHDIAIGVAKGIEYLHQGCDKRILHFDIKPHNILLDHNFNPKISDFGLAKLCSKEQSVVSMTNARGTMGYIAPEVLSRNFGNVSHKSDVYSFGMLLLEMVGGRKNIDVNVESTSKVYFPEWIYNHLDQGEELNIRIKEEGDAKIAKKLAIVGLWCIQWYPTDRPSMKVVVQMLDGEGEKLTIPPNPFASIVPIRTNLQRPRRDHQQELAIILE